MCWEDLKDVCIILLCLELEAEAKLVAASIDVLAIEESRECQLDACRKKDIMLSHAQKWKYKSSTYHAHSSKIVSAFKDVSASL